MWADGLLGARDMRLSLETRDWDCAQATVQKWEAEGRGPLPQAIQREEAITVECAREGFIKDAKARGLCEASLSNYGLLLRRLQGFTEGRGLKALTDLDVVALTEFRAQWKYCNLTSLKNLERLRSFFGFCHDRGWVSENFAKRLKNPRVVASPTLPYSQDEILKTMKAADVAVAEARPHAKPNAIRLRALLLLLRYSGLRIGDAIKCPLDRLVDGKLRLYTQKTGTHVSCPLPEFVVKELEATPRAGEHHWFWRGKEKCKLKTAVTDWQQRIRELFKEAGVANGHAHRFRDTFAVGLLMDGVPLERVSIMLGHSSVKITEKHYSPWIRERQEQAEADVRRTWLRDPLAVMGNAAVEAELARGTPGDTGKGHRIM